MITVVIATRNRADTLLECLTSLSCQESFVKDWRVLVVDNGSEDTTAEIATAFALRDSRFSYVHEPVPGASRARNRGVAEARTPYVLFVDDECTFPEGYIDLACNLVTSREPVCFGGPIHPRYHDTPPRPHWYKSSYGSFSLPENNPIYGPPRLSAGNLGVSRSAMERVGGFPETYGPIGKRMIYGEENVLVAALWRAFGPAAVVYEPRLVNYHLVRPEKYRWVEILKDNFGRGLARGRIHAAGLDVQQRADLLSDSSLPASSQSTRRSRISILKNFLFDLFMVHLFTKNTSYPFWQNIVYEKWMSYFRWIGIYIGMTREIINKYLFYR